MSSKDRSNPVAAFVVIAVMLLPMVYALSIGPACWLVDHGYMAEVVLLIYKPIQRAADYCGPVRAIFGWWLAYWGR